MSCLLLMRIRIFCLYFVIFYALTIHVIFLYAVMIHAISSLGNHSIPEKNPSKPIQFEEIYLQISDLRRSSISSTHKGKTHPHRVTTQRNIFDKDLSKVFYHLLLKTSKLPITNDCFCSLSTPIFIQEQYYNENLCR